VRKKKDRICEREKREKERERERERERKIVREKVREREKVCESEGERERAIVKVMLAVRLGRKGYPVRQDSHRELSKMSTLGAKLIVAAYI